MDCFAWPTATTSKLTDSATFIISANELPKYISKTVNPTFDIHLTILRNLAGSTLAFITCKDFEDGTVEIEVTPCQWPSSSVYHINGSTGCASVDDTKYWWSDNQFFYQDEHNPIGLYACDDDKISINLLQSLPETIKQLAILLHISTTIYKSRRAGIGRPVVWPSLKHTSRRPGAATTAAPPPTPPTTEQVG
ncbi:hypothetical protein E3P99_02094 [Wallemia hederae]|uniref:Uncharacterized protein n=1 Tax=Wallemia hederae TaxID=1540922 RepID=A0A4T0FR60_9BASI|nr:hypothetical protein E3P99_02094 [Wallemia hederae]